MADNFFVNLSLSIFILHFAFFRSLAKSLAEQPAMRNPGVSDDPTGLAAAVQLRLRIADFADGRQDCKL